MKVGKRLWRTNDGDLVHDGDERAVTLAYGVDDELTAADAARYEAAGEDIEEPGTKQAAPAPNKQRTARATK